MTGVNCPKFLRDREAVVLKGSGGGRVGGSDVCDVTMTAAHGAQWMLHVQTAFILDCSVRLVVYDRRVASITVTPLLEVTCASRDPGVIRLNATVVTVRLYHRNASDYSFNLVLTTRNKHPEHESCPWFKCESGDCIPESLMCDGIDNCFDYSDEAVNGTAHCDDYWPFKGENWGVLFSVLGAGAVLGIGAACCRRLRKRRDSLEELYDLNEGPYVHKYAYQYRVIRRPPDNGQHNNHSGGHSRPENHHHHNHHHNDKGKSTKGKHVTVT